MKELALNYLVEFVNFVWEFLFEIFMGFAALGAIALIILVISLRVSENNEAGLRTDYCYKAGYVEVIKSKHEPHYYCFDARRDEESRPIIPISNEVWEYSK